MANKANMFVLVLALSLFLVISTVHAEGVAPTSVTVDNTTNPSCNVAGDCTTFTIAGDPSATNFDYSYTIFSEYGSATYGSCNYNTPSQTSSSTYQLTIPNGGGGGISICGQNNGTVDFTPAGSPYEIDTEVTNYYTGSSYSSYTSNAYLTIDTALGTPTLTLSNDIIETGLPTNGISTVMVSWPIGTGTPSYTVNLYSSANSLCSSSSTNVDTGSTSSNSITFQVSPSSNTYYCATLTDSAANPQTTDSNVAELTVFTAPSTSATATLDIGQTLTANTVMNTGTPQYTENLLEARGSSSNAFAPVGSATCTTINNYAISCTITDFTNTPGTYYFEIKATDSNGNVIYSAPSNPVTVNADMAPTVTPTAPQIDNG